jgi:hypothetical protein
MDMDDSALKIATYQSADPLYDSDNRRRLARRDMQEDNVLDLPAVK